MRNVPLSNKIGKKASMQIIAVLILMLLLLFGLLMFQDKFFKELPGYKSRARCKVSVEANSMLRLPFLEFSPGVDCSTTSVKIKSERKANIEIAKTMTNCWDTFGEGNLNLFSDYGRYCFVCSIIDFENPNFKELPDFYKFMFTARMPRSPETYMDYLTNGNAENLKSQITEQGKDINNIALPVKKYAVYFLYDKGEDFVNKDITTSLFPEVSVSTKPKDSSIEGQSSILTNVGLLFGGGLLGLGIYHGIILPATENEVLRSSIILGEYDAKTLQSLGCTENLPKS